ncbi:hypothetical protein L195_g016009 [Trifolium pratense]|uniref:Reverse transcriptase zinc-binding domain-containing protein n=1 Tax=Trifolium pratense TaxID=57577 RepID=A0A2K3MQ25_TRIPR|nr:hypothetical protein L195_g016009 [Trifolium pratense]
MIKSVLQAISSYVMSVYLLPDSTIKEIERMINFFWWGGGMNNKGIIWLAWDRMAYPKARGGMGFRDLHAFNMAMVAKQGWNIMTSPNTLVEKVYKARWSIETGTNIKVMKEPWQREKDGRGEEVTTQEDWNCIWKVHAPPKVKHLLWRICKGCLPTRVRLKERCVPCPLVCPL